MERTAHTPPHAVTYETTPEGPKIKADQVVTAEADARPKPDPAVPAAEPAAAEPAVAASRRRGFDSSPAAE